MDEKMIDSYKNFIDKTDQINHRLVTLLIWFIAVNAVSAIIISAFYFFQRR